MKRVLILSGALSLFVIGTFIYSCKKDETEKEKEVISSFSYVVDANNFKKVSFTNESQNYSTVTWDFDDGSAVLTEVNTTHVFPIGLLSARPALSLFSMYSVSCRLP